MIYGIRINLIFLLEKMITLKRIRMSVQLFAGDVGKKKLSKLANTLIEHFS